MTTDQKYDWQFINGEHHLRRGELHVVVAPDKFRPGLWMSGAMLPTGRGDTADAAMRSAEGAIVEVAKAILGDDTPADVDDQNSKLGAVIRSAVELLATAPTAGGPPNLMRMTIAVSGPDWPCDRAELVLYRPGGKTTAEIAADLRRQLAEAQEVIHRLESAVAAWRATTTEAP